MDKSSKRKLIDQINQRIKRAEKAFGFDTETKSIWRKQLEEIVPNTDILTKGGLLSMSESSLAELDDMAIEVLKNNIPQSVKELKEEAIERLEDLFESDEDLLAHKDEIIASEVINKLKVMDMLDTEDDKSLISDNLKEWANTLKSIDPMLEIENPDLYAKIYDMDTLTSNIKNMNYTDMMSILVDTKSIAEEYRNYRGK